MPQCALSILDAISDGAIQGIKDSTRRLLQSGKDLDSALQKALDFEGVFKDLKRYKDPLGAALDDLDIKFSGLRKTFQEAAASSEEYAQLEELYGIQRKEIIEQVNEQTLRARSGAC